MHSMFMNRARRTGRSAVAVSAVALAATLLVAGCGGSDDSTTASSNPSTPSAPAAATISGVAASGAALANATITVTDATGKTVTTAARQDGSFSFSAAGLTAPLVLVATDPTGMVAPMVSLLAQVPAAGTTATANVTTLTSAIAALMAPDGNPLSFTQTSLLTSTVTPDALKSAVSALKTVLATILAANNVDPTTFDPISSPFTANRTGADAVIDAVQLITNDAGSVLVSSADSTKTVPLNGQTAGSPPLPTPIDAANYFDYAQKLLNACFADAPGSRSSTKCGAIFDASFLDNSYTTPVSAYPDLGLASSTGMQFGLPRTVRYFTDSNNVRSAVVRIPYTLADGTPGRLMTVIHKLAQPVTLADGTVVTWTIYGNQHQFDAGIRSQITRRTYADSTGVNRFEAGLSISFNPLTSSAQGVNSVRVSGPGIATPIIMMRSSACGTPNYMVMPDPALTMPPVVPPIIVAPPPGSAPGTQPMIMPGVGFNTSRSNTSTYRWSWQSSDATKAFPGTSSLPAWYAPQQVDVSTIPLFAQYTFELFNNAGVSMGSFTVTNESTPVGAKFGTQTAWHTLSQDVVTNLLSPTGSLAGAQASVTLSWTANPLAAALTTLQVLTNGGKSEVDGTAVAPAAGTKTTGTVLPGQFNGSQDLGCTGASFAALGAPGSSRTVSLRALDSNEVRHVDQTLYNVPNLAL